MVLIKSISGVRGLVNQEIGGLSDNEVIKCVEQFLCFIQQKRSNYVPFVVVGRDGRVSGQAIMKLVEATCLKYNIGILSLGTTTTPSVQMAIVTEKPVPFEKCLGGIMVSASHNPIEWNGLKFLNNRGEFLCEKEGKQVFVINDSVLKKCRSEITINNKLPILMNSDNKLKVDSNYLNKHISKILELKDVNVAEIKSKKFKIVVDGINSSGGIYVPHLLEKLGVEVVKINCEPNGLFAHNPEPIPLNLIDLCNKVKSNKADLGIAVDPDVDRLVLVSEDGAFFGEEYTIVAIAQYILNKHPKSSVVSNLSTTQAVKDVANAIGAQHFESKVGEANVVKIMKEKNSILGGEGSGGVIFSPLHLGRDALVGIALFLSYLTELNISTKQLRSRLPSYFMLKEKFLVSNIVTTKSIIESIIKLCKKNKYKYSVLDGVKFHINTTSWAHVRPSNTEPLLRLIIESNSRKGACDLKDFLTNCIKDNL